LPRAWEVHSASHDSSSGLNPEARTRLRPRLGATPGCGADRAVANTQQGAACSMRPPASLCRSPTREGSRAVRSGRITASVCGTASIDADRSTPGPRSWAGGTPACGCGFPMVRGETDAAAAASAGFLCGLSASFFLSALLSIFGWIRLERMIGDFVGFGNLAGVRRLWRGSECSRGS
jgi:hypothetical protein